MLRSWEAGVAEMGGVLARCDELTSTLVSCRASLQLSCIPSEAYLSQLGHPPRPRHRNTMIPLHHQIHHQRPPISAHLCFSIMHCDTCCTHSGFCDTCCALCTTVRASTVPHNPDGVNALPSVDIASPTCSRSHPEVRAAIARLTSSFRGGGSLGDGWRNRCGGARGLRS
jgi:hypothetical protein